LQSEDYTYHFDSAAAKRSTLPQAAVALQVKASRRRGNCRDIEGCNAGEEGEAREGGGVRGDCVVCEEIVGRGNLALLL
jgi:hypothetical protein